MFFFSLHVSLVIPFLFLPFEFTDIASVLRLHLHVGLYYESSIHELDMHSGRVGSILVSASWTLFLFVLDLVFGLTDTQPCYAPQTRMGLDFSALVF